MPDDERLGGTRDPNSRRHRRDEEQPTPEEQPRRRRRSVESGGVSVADLVQRHTGSRPDLTPVNPEQLRSNSVMTGRRALQEGGPPQNRQNAAPPPPPPPPPPAQPIAAALDGTDAYPQDRPAHRGRPADPAPHEDPRRPGGTSSYFTIPSDALRDSVHSGPGEPPAPSGEFPTFPPEPHDGYPLDDAPRRPRRPGEGSGPRNTFPRDESGFPGQDGRRPAPGNRRPSPFASEDPRRGDGFAPDGFPPDPDAPRHGGPRRAGEASAHHPMPGNFAPDEPGSHRRNGRRGVGEASGPRPTPGDGFAPDPGGPRRNGRRAGMGDGFPQDGGFAPDHDSRRNSGRGLADASAHPGDGFPPEQDGPRRNGRRRIGEAAGPRPVPGQAPDGPHGSFGPDPDAARRNGAQGLGDASAHPGEVFPPDRNGRRRNGEVSGLGEAPEGPHGGFAPEQDMPRRNGGRRIGEASTHLPVPGEAPDGPHGGFGPDPDAARRNGGRRIGEASTHLPVPGEAPDGFPPDVEAPRPNGRRGRGRRGGEAAGPIPAGPGGPPGFAPDGELPSRRPGENSGRFGVPGEAPRPRPRPVGEASAHFNVPGEGFPPEPGRPQGAARRRAARAAGPQDELGPPQQPGLFPSDAPPAPGQSSGLFPVDDGRRQEPPGPPDAIDAPGQKSRRISGVPPVPPPPPPMGDDDLVSMTTEMEAIGEEVQQRRKIDHTLARFSAVHDEIKAEEREKKAKRRKLRPWERGDDEMDRLDELDAQQSMAMAIPNLEPKEEDDPATAKKKRRWRKGKNAGKAFAIIFAALVFVSSAVAWGFKSYIEASAQTVDALDPDSDAIKDAAAQNGDENFLLVGSDTRAGAAAEDGVGSESQVVGARSDTVMIAHIPKNRERVVVVSFPRDLEVTRPACEGWDPKTGKYTGVQNPEAKRVKLNTAYQVGGPKCVTKMVQELSGLAVNHFVGIDFNGFKDMVEAVQGVEVCVERPLEDETLGMVVPEAGKNVKLTGDQALNFVRARKVKGDPTSDYGRIIRQQRFLSSLLRKAMSTEVLLNPGKLTNFVDAFSKATFGDNIGIEQLFTLGQSMQGVNAGKVTFITVPTVGEANKRGNEELRAEASNALFEAIRQDVPLPGETTTPDDASTSTQAQQQSGLMAQQQQPSGTVDPKTIKLQVLNGGNDTGGIAGDTADELGEFGFQVVRVGETEPVDKTIIKYSKSREAQAQTVKAAVPGATLVEDASMSGAILLILGPEFDGTVQSPTGGGQTPEVPDGLSTVNAGDVSCA